MAAWPRHGAVLATQPLAVHPLEGEFRDGDTILMDAAGGAIEFRRAEVVAA